MQDPKEGNAGWFVWGKQRLAALIDWNDPVVRHGLSHRIKFTRLLRRKAFSPRAAGVDCQGYRDSVQLALEGSPYQKPKHQAGLETVGLDLGPSTIAIVPQEGPARLLPFCEDLQPNARAKRRLARKLDRKPRANNPHHYDQSGRIKKGRKRWHDSQGYKARRRRLANRERKLAAHRKSLHGRLAHAVVGVGSDIRLEKISYKACQKQYGKSVGLTTSLQRSSQQGVPDLSAIALHLDQ